MSDGRGCNLEVLNKEKIRSEEYISYLQRRAKFKMFFASLIFAVLSFAGAHPIITNLLILKKTKTISMFLMLISGTILILQLAGYEISAKGRKTLIRTLIFEKEIIYWICFIVGIFLMILNRSILLFMN